MKLLSIINSPWAIQPEKLMQIREIYAEHIKRPKINIAEIEAQIGHPLGRKEQGYQVAGRTAIIPIDGPIAKKMNLFSQISGGASSELIKRDFIAAMADSSIDSIVLHIDSPGGTVDGTQELAQAIYEARGTKKITAYCDGTMASAAYWIGSAADEIIISSDTVGVGSIGVVATHQDISKAEETAGIKTTEITAGKFKRISSAHAPLTEEGRDTIQAQVDHIYSAFVGDVARNRGVSIEEVLTGMADGKVFIGQQAIEAGLVDGVATLDDLIAKLHTSDYTNYKLAAGCAAESEDIVNIETLKEQYQEVYQAIVSEATAGMVAASAVEEAKAAAATAERERIAACFSVSVPGHDALVKAMAFDGTSTAADVALAVVGAEQKMRSAALADLEEDANEAVPPAEDQGGSQPDESTEEGMKAVYDASADLQKEFGSFGAYAAYKKSVSTGRARILGR